jgi:hypothetical protein
MPNVLVEKIREILKQIFGEPLSDSIVRVNCQRIGVSPENLTLEQIPEFLQKLKITLLLFLDEKETEDILQRIEKIKI